ncbi:DUF6158 family protein [Longispora sp. K20-0274]|uniref:DUF6158 family protein n=1 Tax=Longispora sp. K20-0274 TaxID=3088255 RepID=UPI003999B8A1
MADHLEDPAQGVPAASLSDDAVERELASLDRTRRDALGHGTDSAVATHQRRTAELADEAERRGLYRAGVPGSDPGASSASAGIPEYADDDDPRPVPDDPERPAVAGDAPIGLDEYGTTVRESRHRESLDRRLAREEPEIPTEWPNDGRPNEEQAIHITRRP